MRTNEFLSLLSSMGGPESLRLLQYLVDVRSPRESTFSVIRLIAMMNASELWEGVARAKLRR